MSEIDSTEEGISRRDLLKTTTKLATLTGLGAVAGAGALMTPADVRAAVKNAKANIEPGELDEYYGIWSGGQSGEVRV